MKKFSKIGKRVLAFFLVALMNINSYAAVGANDGSAFVTKAEFDGLVQDFNKQMDSYQAGLNARIDDAISKYLAGASGTKQEKLENLHERVAGYDSKYVTFWNYPAKGFTDSNDNNYGRASASYNVQINNNDANTYSNYGKEHNKSNTSSGTDYVDFPNAPKNALYYLKGGVDIADAGSGYDDTIACLEEAYAYSDLIEISVNESYHSISAGQNLSASQLESQTDKSHTVDVQNQNGESGTYGSAESTQVIGHSFDCSAEISEKWEKYDSLVFNGAGYPSCNAVGSQTLYCVNYNNRTKFDSDDQISVSDVQGSGAGGKFYTLKPGGGNVASKELTSGFTWTFKYFYHKLFEVDAVKLVNYAAALVTGEPVRLYNGVPLTKVNGLGEVTLRCTITNSAGNDTYITVSDEPFDNDDRYSTKEYTAEGKTYDHILLNQKLTSGTPTDIKFNVTYLTNDDKLEGRILYYRLSQETSTDNTVKMSMDITDNIVLKKSY